MPAVPLDSAKCVQNWVSVHTKVKDEVIAGTRYWSKPAVKKENK